jgi:hypothetical protein
MQGMDLSGLVVSVLATDPKVRGFDPDRGRWIFKGDKNPEHHFRKQNSKWSFLTQVSWLPARWLWRSHQDRQNSSHQLPQMHTTQ